MSAFTITVSGKGIQQRSLDKLVQSLKELKEDVSVTVTENKPATSRAARFDEAVSNISEGRSEIEALRDELQDWYDNLPENFQSGEKGDSLQSAIDELESVLEGSLADADGASVDFPGMY